MSFDRFWGLFKGKPGDSEKPEESEDKDAEEWAHVESDTPEDPFVPAKAVAEYQLKNLESLNYQELNILRGKIADYRAKWGNEPPTKSPTVNYLLSLTSVKTNQEYAKQVNDLLDQSFLNTPLQPVAKIKHILNTLEQLLKIRMSKTASKDIHGYIDETFQSILYIKPTDLMPDPERNFKVIRQKVYARAQELTGVETKDDPVDIDLYDEPEFDELEERRKSSPKKISPKRG